MAIWNIVIFLLIGLVAGWLAALLMRGKGLGIVGNMILGVIGAFVGGFLFRLVGLAAYSLFGSIIVATVGAIVLILLVRLIKKV